MVVFALRGCQHETELYFIMLNPNRRRGLPRRDGSCSLEECWESGLEPSFTLVSGV